MLLRALAPLLPGLRLESGAAAGACLNAIRGAKSTTGIVGLPVVPDARQELQAQLQAVLDALAVIPEDAEYRRSVEKTVRWKLQAAAAADTPDEQLEELFSRQLEEEIKMCQEELTLIPKMAGVWRSRGGRERHRWAPPERRTPSRRQAAAAGRQGAAHCRLHTACALLVPHRSATHPCLRMRRVEAVGRAGGPHGGCQACCAVGLLAVWHAMAGAASPNPCLQHAMPEAASQRRSQWPAAPSSARPYLLARAACSRCLLAPTTPGLIPLLALQVEMLEEQPVEGKVGAGAPAPPK